MMMKHKLSTLAVAALFTLTTVSVNAAQIVKIDFSWLGSNNYRMDGSFTFDESFNGRSNLVASNLSTFSFTAYLNNNSIGTWNMTNGVEAGRNFNFNFNTITNQFAYGGGATSTSGQQWNTVNGISVNANIGFQSGGTSPYTRQFFVLPGESQNTYQNMTSMSGNSTSIQIDSNRLIALTPTFINTSPVPEADTSAMLLMGAGVMGFMARRRKQLAA
jgi:hypothetical protein